MGKSEFLWNFVKKEIENLIKKTVVNGKMSIQLGYLIHKFDHKKIVGFIMEYGTRPSLMRAELTDRDILVIAYPIIL